MHLASATDSDIMDGQYLSTIVTNGSFLQCGESQITAACFPASARNPARRAEPNGGLGPSLMLSLVRKPFAEPYAEALLTWSATWHPSAAKTLCKPYAGAKGPIDQTSFMGMAQNARNARQQSAPQRAGANTHHVDGHGQGQKQGRPPATRQTPSH